MEHIGIFSIMDACISRKKYQIMLQRSKYKYAIRKQQVILHKMAKL